MEVAYVMLGLLTPVLALLAFIVPLTKLFKVEKTSKYIALAASVFATIAASLVFHCAYHEGPMIYMYGGWPPHFGIVYEVDVFNGLIGLFTAWVMLAIVLYSWWYSHHLDEPSWYYTLLIGLEMGILGCIFTGDAFNLFVMLEVLGISAYGLVAYHRDKPEAVEAAAKYAIIGAVATTFYFTAVILLYAGYGSVNMAVLAENSRRVPIAVSLRYVCMLSIALALWVFTYKSAIFPNHFWLPDAHPEAPTPVSAALSGLVVNVGVYATARFLYTLFGSDSLISPGFREVTLTALFILGTMSGVVGALMMMSQRDIKRLLAYSTICHMGLIYMGLSAGFLVGSEEAINLAIAGATIHIIAHGLAKALLFMASGVLIDAAGSRDLDEMRGVGRSYPLTSFSLIVGFLNLAGFLPFVGFYSKLLIALGYLNAGFVLGAVLLIVISALSIPGYLKAISATVFATGGSSAKPISGRWVEVLLAAMALSLLVLGLAFSLTWNIYIDASLELTTRNGVEKYISEALSNIPPELIPWLKGFRL